VLQSAYERFSVPGVKPEDAWQLFNVSNYEYFRQKVADLRQGKCPFCEIDPTVNEVLAENGSWRLWMNTMAPRSGQQCQLIIPSKRHIERISEMTKEDWFRLEDILAWGRLHLGVGRDGVLLLRTGDPARNAKSVPHLHWNFQLPTGMDRVEVTIAKSPEDLEKKLVVLLLWERYRIAEEAGNPNPETVLTDTEWALIKNKMRAPATTK